MEHKRMAPTQTDTFSQLSDDESQFNNHILPRKKVKVDVQDPNEQLFKAQFMIQENNTHMYSQDFDFLRACSCRTISAKQYQKPSSFNAFQQIQSDKKISKRRKSFGMSSQKNSKKINSLKELMIDRGSCCSLASDFDKQNERFSINTINTSMINDIKKIKIDQNQEQQSNFSQPPKVIKAFSQFQVERKSENDQQKK